MYQIKIFQNDSIEDLQNDVNVYLRNLDYDTKVEIKYQVEHRSIGTDSETGVYPDASHTIIVIMS